MEEILNALLEYLKDSPLWLICLALLYCEGNLFLLLIYGFKFKIFKKIKKVGEIIIPIVMGMALSGSVFLFQNFKTIIESEMTLEIMETNMLSSIILSFAIVAVPSLIILPIREQKRLKGNNKNKGNNRNKGDNRNNGN